MRFQKCLDSSEYGFRLDCKLVLANAPLKLSQYLKFHIYELRVKDLTREKISMAVFTNGFESFSHEFMVAHKVR